MNFAIGLFLGIIIGIAGTSMCWMMDIIHKYKRKEKSYGKRA